jgi:hypothetical protein
LTVRLTVQAVGEMAEVAREPNGKPAGLRLNNSDARAHLGRPDYGFVAFQDPAFHAVGVHASNYRSKPLAIATDL